MYGPIGSAEVTMADPLRGGGQTFPSVLLTFGTLVLRAGWYNHGIQGSPTLTGSIGYSRLAPGSPRIAQLPVPVGGWLRFTDGVETSGQYYVAGEGTPGAGATFTMAGATVTVVRLVRINSSTIEVEVSATGNDVNNFTINGYAPGAVSEGLYGNIEGDLVVQLIDVSSGTPVIVQRAVKPMRPIYGDYPGDGFRLLGVKLDATRAMLTWDDIYSQPVIIVSVAGGQVTFGEPVDIGGDLVPYYDDGRPRYSFNGSTGMGHDSIRNDDLTALEGGFAAFTSLAHVNHVQDDGTTWENTRVGCLLSTEGLVITSYKWFYLGGGYPRFSYPNIGDTYNASTGIGGLAMVFVGTIQQTQEFSSSQGVLYSVDYAGVSTTQGPSVASRVLPAGTFNTMMTDGEYLVMSGDGGYSVMPVSDPIGGTLESAPFPDGEQYHSPWGASYQTQLPPVPTPRGWLMGTYDPSSKLNEFRRSGPGVVEATGEPVVLNRTPPEVNSEAYGYTAVMAGTRYAVALVDFEVNDPPYNYREFLYTYEPLRMGNIDNGRRRGAFLQVRAGNS